MVYGSSRLAIALPLYCSLLSNFLDHLQRIRLRRLLKGRLSLPAATACPAWFISIFETTPRSFEGRADLHSDVNDLPGFQFHQGRGNFHFVLAAGQLDKLIPDLDELAGLGEIVALGA